MTWRHLLTLAAILLLAGTALSVALTGDGPRSWHEAVTLRCSHETWLRVHDDVRDNVQDDVPPAWIIPHIYGRPRVVKPPMMVWVQLIAWSGLSPDSFGDDRHLIDVMIARARYAGVGLGLITMIAVFIIGTRLLDARWGLIAAGMLGTLPIFQEYARSASHDIGLLAGTTVAIAGAACALTTDRKTWWCAGWIAFALGLIFGWLSKGPLAILIAGIPVLPLIFLLHRPAGRNVLGLAAALALAAAVVAPWYMALGSALENGSLAQQLANEYEGPGRDHRPPWYYARHVNWTLPWALFFLAGLAHPWVRHRGAARRIRLGPWLWFLLLLALFSAAPAKVQRYVLPLAPAVALVAALVWRDHDEAQQSGDGRPAAWIHWTHWIACAAAALGFLLVATMSDSLAQRGWMPGEIARRMSPEAWPTISLLMPAVILAALSVAGLVLTKHRRFMLAAVTAIAWAAIFTGLLLRLSFNPADAARFNAIHQNAMQIEMIAGEEPLYAMKPRGIDADLCRLGLLLNRPLPAIVNKAFRALVKDSPEPFYIITHSESQADLVARQGGERILDEYALAPLGYELWKVTPQLKPPPRRGEGLGEGLAVQISFTVRRALHPG